MDTWIKLYRKFTEWEWYNISEMVHLFIHLLISANNEDGEWRGVKIKRGQLITGRKNISEDTGISEQTIRTCLKRLEKTKEITIEPTNKFSLITICNYNNYQEIKKRTNQQPNQQLTSNQPTTNHKQEYKDIKEYYDREILLSANDENYKKVVAILFGENNLSIPLDVLLKMETQLSYSQFKKIWYVKEKYKISITQVFEKIQDWGNPKKRKTIYGVFQTFAKNSHPEITEWDAN